MTTIDFHDRTTRDAYLDIASSLCAYPGIQAPVMGSGMLVRVINKLLCPADAGPATIALLLAWAARSRWDVVDEGMFPGQGDTHIHVRLNKELYIIRAKNVPTLFTLLLPLVPWRRATARSLVSPSWNEAEQPWRNAAMDAGFKKLYPNEGKSFGLCDGKGWTLFVDVNAASAIHLANAANPDEFFAAAAKDERTRTTEVGETSDRVENDAGSDRRQ